jgi:Ca2+-binding EF-hand superfamily protein
MARGGSYKSMPDMSKIKHFTEDDVLLIKDGFDIFDHGKQLIDLKEILEFTDKIQGFDKFPTVYNLIAKIAEANPKGVNFKTFLETFHGYLGNAETKNGLQKLFETIDFDENQFLDRERLKSLAKEIGEKVTDEQIDYLIEEGYNCPTGKVDQDAFVRMMLKASGR